MHHVTKRPREMKQATPCVGCTVGVVHEITLSCGKVYVSQTGRRVNGRARQHALSIKTLIWLAFADTLLHLWLCSATSADKDYEENPLDVCSKTFSF